MTMKIKETLSGTPINEAEFKKWLKALRSGRYTQVKGFLNIEGGYCCLGVACDALIPKENIKYGPNGDIYGWTPCDQTHTPPWLALIAVDVYQRFTFFKGEPKQANPFFNANLITINDKGLMTFAEIADALEMCYVHGIFEE